MKAMQLVHEAEVQRQHPRLRVPLSVELKGQRYEAVNLSVGGVGLPPEAGPLVQGATQEMVLHVPFDDFEMSLPVTTQVRHGGNETVGPGLCFVDTSRRQQSFLHYIVNGYLSGQVVRAGDVFEVAARDSFVPERAQKTQGAGGGKSGRLKRAVGLTVVTLVGLVCFGFVATSIAERTFVTEAAGTVSSLHSVVVRAPMAGLVRSLLITPGTDVAQDTVVAVIESELGATQYVRSPCDCVLATTYIADGEYVNLNQALVGMTPDAAAKHVIAQLPLGAARDVKPGDDVFIDFLDGRPSGRGNVEQVRAASVDPNSYAGRSFNTPALARIEVTLTDELPVSEIGQPVALRISSISRTMSAAAAFLKE